MKRLTYIFLILSTGFIFAQEKEITFFDSNDIGIYSGINFYNTKNLRGDFFMEFKTDLLSSLKLKASVGYFNSVEPYNYTVRNYNINTIDTLPKYFAYKYNLLSKNYDVFPIALGLQYYIFQSIFSPYISIDAAYNFINSTIITTPSENWSYNSLAQIPPEFKEISNKEVLPNNSYGIMLGAGVSYSISQNFNLDLRYILKFDNKIINTHHFTAGIYF